VKVREQFMTPLRSLLVATKAHCKREVEIRREEVQAGESSFAAILCKSTKEPSAFNHLP